MRYFYILKYYWMKMRGYRKTDPRLLLEKCIAIDSNPKNWCKISFKDGTRFKELRMIPESNPWKSHKKT